MPTNLPPKYYVAEEAYRAAIGPADKSATLQQMLSATPKHKGTDHLRADLRAKISKALEELENPKRGAGRPSPYAIRKEGAGQAVLIGKSNAGKSQLVATLTGADAKVAAYPFTTRIPLPGMLPFQNVKIQLVDTPAIDDPEVQSQLFSLVRNTDLVVAVVDLSEDPLTDADEILAELDRFGYRLLEKSVAVDPDDPLVQKPCLLVGSKSDQEDADVAFELLEELYAPRFSTLRVSADIGIGLDALGEAIFQALGKVRVYLKAGRTETDFGAPEVLTIGSMVEDAAISVHKDWARKFKFALLWGSGKYDGQRVGRDYVLKDGDVIELHS